MLGRPKYIYLIFGIKILSGQQMSFVHRQYEYVKKSISRTVGAGVENDLRIPENTRK